MLVEGKEKLIKNMNEKLNCKDCCHYNICNDKKNNDNCISLCDEFLNKDYFVKHGEWKELDVCKHICSMCGKKPYIDDVGEILSDYCPHCGARLFRKTPYGTF